MAAAEQIDQQLLSALKKQRAGGKLTQREDNALRRRDKQQRERYGIAYVRELPKKDVLAAIGVTNKTLLEWDARLDAPWRPHSKTVDGFSLLRWACSIISECSGPIFKHLKTKRSKAAIEEFLEGVPADWQEECFKEKALELRDKRLVREGVLLDAETFGGMAFTAADGFRDFVERLGKRFGQDAQKMALAWWSDWEDSVNNVLADDDGSGR